MRNTTSRRSILAGLVALPVAAAPALAGETQPGAELVALGRSLRLAWADETVAYAHSDTMPDAEADEYVRRFHDVSSALVDRIIARPARTAEGVMVKVLAWAWCQGGPDQVFESLGDDMVTDERAITSAARDVVRLMGIAGASS